MLANVRCHDQLVIVEEAVENLQKLPADFNRKSAASSIAVAWRTIKSLGAIDENRVNRSSTSPTQMCILHVIVCSVWHSNAAATSKLLVNISTI